MVRRRRYQQRKEFATLDEDSRPSVNEQQWDRIFDPALLMQVVDLQRPMAIHLDAPSKHRKRIDIGFVLPPVIPLSPSRDETLDVCERNAIVPASPVELVGEASQVKLLLEGGEVGVGNSERPFISGREQIRRGHRYPV